MSPEIIYLIILAVIVGINSGVIYVLWHQLKTLRLRMEQNYTAQQRLGREIAQHRYSLAVLHQKNKNDEMKQQKAKIGSGAGKAKTTQDQDEILQEINAIEEEIKASAQENTGGDDISLVENQEVSSLKNNEILELIKLAVRENKIALAQQPVMLLPEKRIGYYEIFSRIHVPDQGYIPAHKFIAIAKSNNLVGAVDNLLMLRCLQLLKDKAESNENIEFFINTNPQAFISKTYLSGLVKFLAANPRLSSKLIFEMPQVEWLNLSPSVKTVLDNLSLLGCRFSMDQVSILGMDINRILKQNISFVKLDAQILIKDVESSGSTARIRRMKNSLDAQQINVVIEKIENEKQLLSLYDLQIDFGQGYLFGEPVIVE